MDQRNNNEFDILLIDNKDISRNTTFNILSNSGYKVDIAMHGKDGILKLKENHFVYKLVITEVIMPYASGFEVIEYVKNNSKIPVMVLSSINDERTIESIYSINTDEIVKKPFMITDLLQKVKRLISIAPKSPSYMTPKTTSYFEPKVSPATLGLLDELEPSYNPPPVNLNPIEILPYVKPKNTRQKTKEVGKKEIAKKTTTKTVTVAKKDVSKPKTGKSVEKAASKNTVVPKTKANSGSKKNEIVETKTTVKKVTLTPKAKTATVKATAKAVKNPTRKVSASSTKTKDIGIKANATKRVSVKKEVASTIQVESPKKKEKTVSKTTAPKKSSEKISATKVKPATKTTTVKATPKKTVSIKVKGPLVKPVTSKVKKETASTSKKQKASR